MSNFAYLESPCRVRWSLRIITHVYTGYLCKLLSVFGMFSCDYLHYLFLYVWNTRTPIVRTLTALVYRTHFCRFFSISVKVLTAFAMLLLVKLSIDYKNYFILPKRCDIPTYISLYQYNETWTRSFHIDK